MMLRPRVLITGLVFAVPAAIAVGVAVERVRAEDMRVALDRVVRSQVNDQVKERCESDPRWFMTGPTEGRPPRGIFTGPEGALEPRPKNTNQAFELFAYDEEFRGTSTAAVQFPAEFRRAMQRSSLPAYASFPTSAGTGVQMAVPTGWIGSPCMYFLGRLAPPPDQLSQRLKIIAGVFAVAFAVALLTVAQTVWRVRRLASDARESANEGYSAIAPDRLRDELSSMAFMFNDASKELHLRSSRIEDQNIALRRIVQNTEEEVGRPLEQLSAKLAAMEMSGTANQDGAVREALLAAHAVTMQVQNLTATAKLRQAGGVQAEERVDLNDVLGDVQLEHEALAHAAGVAIRCALPDTAVVIAGDRSLVERAIANVVDNAIRYNSQGGRVDIALTRGPEPSAFQLSVTDNGRGVTDEQFKLLTAVRRFRGDEGRNRKPGRVGLGLAVTQEVIDRLQMKLELRRREHGFEAIFSGQEL